jgi:hypothetical protein
MVFDSRFPGMKVTDEPTYKSEKGAINGIASLDALGKVPDSQLNIIGTQYLGLWDANINTPTIVSSTHAGSSGDFYVVGVAGTTLIDGINSWAVGDTIIWNGLIWQKYTSGNVVLSVNSKVGIVVLAVTDMSDVDASTTAILKNNLASIVDPLPTNDSSQGYAPGSTWINTVKNIIWSLLDNSVGSAIWTQTGIIGQKGRRVDTMSWASNAEDFISKNSALTYTSQATMEYKGSDSIGVPQKISIIGRGSSATPTYSIRIYDITNALVIAELTAQSNTVKTAIDMGAISNVPTGNSIWEIQTKRDSGGNVAFELSALTIEY